MLTSILAGITSANPALAVSVWILHLSPAEVAGHGGKLINTYRRSAQSIAPNLVTAADITLPFLDIGPRRSYC